MPINEAIDNRISLTPGSDPLYPEAYQKSLQTIDLDFYFHKAKMNHFDLIDVILFLFALGFYFWGMTSAD